MASSLLLHVIDNSFFCCKRFIDAIKQLLLLLYFLSLIIDWVGKKEKTGSGHG